MIFGKRKTELRSWKSNYTTVIVKGKQQSLFFQSLDVFKLPQLNKLPSSLKFKQKYVCERQRPACEQVTLKLC